MMIRTLRLEDLERVARIHYGELPDDFCSVLGFDFLRKIFYPELLRRCEIKLGAVDEHDIVQGFMFFASDRKLFRRLVFGNISGIVRWVDWRVLFQARFLRSVAGVIIILMSAQEELLGWEQVYLAVSKSHQGKWVAFQLFQQGFRELTTRGVRHCWLKTLKATPQNILLYERIGFRKAQEYCGRVYMTREI